MGTQHLGPDGQAVFTKKRCRHGLFQDDRGNTACEVCMSMSKTESYTLGISVGYQEVFALLKEEAGKAYAADKDEEAKLLKKWAKKFEEIYADKRKEFESKRAQLDVLKETG